ncbi:hypothetical protein HG535_0F03640 [Zygotorulaspora mrakii]|uniref:CBM21 domain-containing protein n=1 Tax=Zygotorulaspora mrakii TaxID=42260 RepID=A0A7H9B5V2_ZYGMR|nr:uncharacterized protein HG535_0F03640 [Zygotorulaspora mrakii]QLG73853.1 hypothetical protein HG535_0F03640 [Zygotorulaspora mrakii]
MYVKVGGNADGNKGLLSKRDNKTGVPEDELRSHEDVTKSASSLMMRRLNKNEDLSASLNSLAFLHKPQRVKTLNSSLYPDEEIIRNTNINKNLNNGSTDKKVIDDEAEAEVSPTSSYKLARVNDLLINRGGDENMFPIPPVYKKSGELVKSSLKRRSKSLPTSPHVNSEHKNFTALRPGGRLQRSKSVHFDQKTPIKYFREDESPIDVSTKENERTEEISFRHKPVGYLFGGNDDDDDDDDDDEGASFNDTNLLAMRIDSINLGTATRTGNTISRPPSHVKDRSLRKSKRFSAMARDIPKRESSNKHENSGTSKYVGNSNNNHSCSNNNRVVGLYNENFPILSNKNPKSLKLNIFINLSQDKKCFLQEITLYGARDQHTYPSKKTQTRMIAGRVLVKNIFFDKKVVVRYTWDHWRTSHDVECVYVSDGDGILPGTNMDIFNFIIDDVNKQDSRAKLEFCIHYVTRNDYQRREFWDSNNGKNYKIDCITDGFTNPFSD